MNKILVISDTHNNLKYQELAINKVPDANLIIHLGDNYDDAEDLINQGYQVIRVPGVWCPDYSNEAVDNRKIFVIDGWHFFISHTKTSHEYDLAKDLKPEETLKKNEIDVFLYGHTHIPELNKENSIIICNPGHLKSIWEKGYSPSFAVITTSENELKIQIRELLEEKIITEAIFKKEI